MHSDIDFGCIGETYRALLTLFSLRGGRSSSSTAAFGMHMGAVLDSRLNPDVSFGGQNWYEIVQRTHETDGRCAAKGGGF